MIANYTEYTALYGAEITEAEFNRIGYDIERFMDANTTGIDNVHKLYYAFPANVNDATAIKHCFCNLIHTQYEIEAYQAQLSGANGHGAIASVSSGSESVSYARVSTVLDAAVNDMTARAKLYADKMRYYLSGVCDNNGVNILYMGGYPKCTRIQ